MEQVIKSLKIMEDNIALNKKENMGVASVAYSDSKLAKRIYDIYKEEYDKVFLQKDIVTIEFK